MSFLQPAILMALPVIALPIIIHLINQRRFQTVQWAAMQFLLAANRMSRGYARLRQWLILAARTLAIAGLIFAISRPLSSGWLGLAGGGQVDTTIILLDRSPSMTQTGPGGVSKLQAGIKQMTQSLKMLRSARYVLIDSANGEAREIDSPAALAAMAETIPVSQSAELPTMLETTDQYIRANRPSRCEVWICSDVRKTDWQSESGRWEPLRSSLAELPQMVRFHLLAYPESADDNRLLRVNSVRRVDRDQGAELLLSLRIEQSSAVEGTTTVPIQLELDGARSEFEIEMTGSEFELVDHSVPIDGGQVRGWGRISIPSDSSPADNEFYFVYDREMERRTVIVADDPDAAAPLEFAASVPPDPAIPCSANTLTADDFMGTSLEDVSLLLWQSAIPSERDPVFPILQQFLSDGGQVIFFPPAEPGDAALAGVRWTRWQGDQGKNIPVSTWVGDQDLLAATRSGVALPVGDWKVSRHCLIEGRYTALATLDGGEPLLARAMTDRGNVYFCCTTPSASDSSLAIDGVILYVMIQRAMEAGVSSLGNTRQLIAGEIETDKAGDWTLLAGNPDALSNTYALHAGVYQSEQQLLAVNRSELEDLPSIVPRDRVAALFDGLDFHRLDDTAGSGTSLIQEIWRLFLVGMLLALMIEAVLCLPRAAAHSPAASGEGMAA